MKYTCQVPDNSLVVFGIPKNPYFDSSHVYIASFLKILLHNANAAFFLGHPVASVLFQVLMSASTDPGACDIV